MTASDTWRQTDPEALADWPTRIKFWQKVRVADGCWEWTGSRISAMGYGQFKPSRNHSPIGAHRYIFQVLHGPLMWRQQVCHRCDNPLCVRPDHLFLGDHAANMADRQAKKRHSHGERHGTAKLTDAKVLYARERLAAGDKQCDLARELGVHKTLLSLIARGKVWRHLQ